MDRDPKLFQETLDKLGLIDIPIVNGTFTWNNRRDGTRHIASILDHFLLSENIFMTSWEMNSKIIPQMVSNHWPIALDVQI